MLQSKIQALQLVAPACPELLAGFHSLRPARRALAHQQEHYRQLTNAEAQACLGALELVERMAVPDERGTLSDLRGLLARMGPSPFGLAAFSAARAELQERAWGRFADLTTLAQRLASAAAVGDAAQAGAEMAAAALHMQTLATIGKHLAQLHGKLGEAGVQAQVDKWQAQKQQLEASLDELLSASRPFIEHVLIPFSTDQGDAFMSGLRDAAILVAGLAVRREGENNLASKATALAESKHLRFLFVASIQFFTVSAAQLPNLGPLLVDRLMEPAFRAACLDINRLHQLLLEVATDATTYNTFSNGLFGSRIGTPRVIMEGMLRELTSITAPVFAAMGIAGAVAGGQDVEGHRQQVLQGLDAVMHMLHRLETGQQEQGRVMAAAMAAQQQGGGGAAGGGPHAFLPAP